LRKASSLWNISLNSLLNILNDKTWTRKVGLKGVLIAREDVGILTWILTMHKVGLSINIQQLKQKVAKIIKTKPTPFWNGVPKNSWWCWFKCHNPYLYIHLVEGSM
jgi:hypothetical protein